jgi:hypothetical protein
MCRVTSEAMKSERMLKVGQAVKKLTVLNVTQLASVRMASKEVNLVD